MTADAASGPLLILPQAGANTPRRRRRSCVSYKLAHRLGKSVGKSTGASLAAGPVLAYSGTCERGAGTGAGRRVERAIDGSERTWKT
jgi:hypothetical protein